MTRQICPNCRQANALRDQFCSHCGQSLAIQHNPLGSRSVMTVGSGSLLPSPSMRQVGQAVAVSLVALAAEVGLIMLRRRVAQMSRREPQPATVSARTKELEPQHTTVISRRVTQIWRKGRLSGQVVEHSVFEEYE